MDVASWAEPAESKYRKFTIARLVVAWYSASVLDEEAVRKMFTNA